jgi:hypothetical protein
VGRLGVVETSTYWAEGMGLRVKVCTDVNSNEIRGFIVQA